MIGPLCNTKFAPGEFGALGTGSGLVTLTNNAMEFRNAQSAANRSAALPLRKGPFLQPAAALTPDHAKETLRCTASADLSGCTVMYQQRAFFRPSAAHRTDQSSKLGSLVKDHSERIPALVGIKLLHTAVWLFFAGCIVAIPYAGTRRQFRLAAILTGLVLVECAVLAVNRSRCPLTDLARRYTATRSDNFDIYLPLWLARRNKMIFGTLFALGELFVFGRWMLS